jgi:hypothetical protein
MMVYRKKNPYREMVFCLGAMLILVAVGGAHVTMAAVPVPDADELASANAQRVLAYGVVACAFVISVLAGVIVWLMSRLMSAQAERIKAVEAQALECKACAVDTRKSVDEFAEAVRDLRKHFHERADDYSFHGTDRRGVQP